MQALEVLVVVVTVDGAAITGRHCLGLCKRGMVIIAVVLGGGAVEPLLKDRLGLVDLELGAEVLKVVAHAKAVGSAAQVVPVEVFVDDLLAWATPVIVGWWLALPYLQGKLGFCCRHEVVDIKHIMFVLCYIVSQQSGCCVILGKETRKKGEREREREHSPVALAAAVLLGLLGVNALEAVLAKELGAVLHRQGSALGDAGVVLAVGLVRSGHFWLWKRQAS